jgi:hypothetical protein
MLRCGSLPQTVAGVAHVTGVSPLKRGAARPYLLGRVQLLRPLLVGAAALGLTVGLPLRASALGMTMSPNEGPPGSRVTVHLTQLEAPCEVRFDGSVVVPSSACQPGADGSASPTFSIPQGAGTGSHQVVVSANTPSSTNLTSTAFRVVSAPPPPPPSPRPSPSPTKTTPKPSPTPTPSATPSPSPTATPSPTPTEGNPSCDLESSSVQEFRITPRQGEAGSQPVAVIRWSDRDGCPEARARVTFDGRPISDSLAVGGPPSRMVLQIPKNSASGSYVIDLVEQGGDEKLLARNVFEVEEPEPDQGLWLPLAAALLAAAVGLGLWRRRKGALKLPRPR